VIFRQVVGIDVAGVQEAEMRGIDVALERPGIKVNFRHSQFSD
jgi:hypothetical protein